MNDVLRIKSRDNPLLKTLRQLARDNSGYRRDGRLWLEGEHLCRAAARCGLQPVQVVYSETAWARRQLLESDADTPTMLVPDRLFADFSQLDSPTGVGWVLQLNLQGQALAKVPTVVLDRIQDAGNVGSILRSASAFGFTQVLAMQGTAALWGPKVLRAGMGAHFSLHLVESLEAQALTPLALPVLVTQPHRGEPIDAVHLPWPCAWVFGHEGQGVSESLQRLASQTLRIAQPGGEESLNVAACAAICLHASSSRWRRLGDAGSGR